MNAKSLNVTSPSQLKLVKYFLKTSSEKLYLRLEKLTMMDFFYWIMLAKEMVFQYIGGCALDEILYIICWSYEGNYTIDINFEKEKIGEITLVVTNCNMNSPRFISNFEFSITTDFAVGDKVGKVAAIDEDDGFNGFFNFVQIDQSKSPFYVDLKWVSECVTDVGDSVSVELSTRSLSPTYVA